MAMAYSRDADDCAPGTCSERQHDILASLAIAKGFCAALDSSFTDFLAGLKASEDAQLLSASSSHDLTKVESDYRFCFSRLLNSLERLETQLVDAASVTCYGDCSDKVE
ncbi:MAG: hypothetical protein AB8B63_00565 [Granulosicoccus sp.]